MLLAAVGASSAFAAPPLDFKEANSLYQSGKFKDAVKIYEDLVKSGRKTEAVYFNLGNAYFRAGQKGKALIAYQRAIRIAPRDEDLKWNLRILRSTLTDHVDRPSEDLALSLIKRVAARLRADEIENLFSALLLTFFAVHFFAWMFPQIKTLAGFLAGILSVCLIAAGIFFFIKWMDVKDPCAVVVEKEVSARYGPSAKETKAFVLHEGASGRVKDQTQDWVYIELENKSTGWVPRASCEVV